MQLLIPYVYHLGEGVCEPAVYFKYSPQSLHQIQFHVIEQIVKIEEVPTNGEAYIGRKNSKH